jgi:hypothetical protein
MTVRKDLLQIEEQLRRIAAVLQKISRKPEGNKPHPELAQVAKRFTRVGDTLEKSLAAGRGVTATQVRSIATQLEAVAATLRKHA